MSTKQRWLKHPWRVQESGHSNFQELQKDDKFSHPFKRIGNKDSVMEQIMEILIVSLNCNGVKILHSRIQGLEMEAWNWMQNDSGKKIEEPLVAMAARVSGVMGGCDDPLSHCNALILTTWMDSGNCQLHPMPFMVKQSCKLLWSWFHPWVCCQSHWTSTH